MNVSKSRRSGWLFPDSNINPTEDVINNSWYSIRASWYHVNGDGGLVQRSGPDHGAYFYYTGANARTVRQNCIEPLVNVSASTEQMQEFLATTARQLNAKTVLVNFCVNNHFAGVDLDFEGYGDWTPVLYEQFKAFLIILGEELHKRGLILSVEVPPIWNNKTFPTSTKEWMQRNSQEYYVLTYQDFVNLPVDKLTIMAYDYHYDMGAGAPNQPLLWLEDIILWAKNTIGLDRVAMGLPAAGYKGTEGQYDIVAITSNSTPAGATRDSASQELTWRDAENKVNFVSDNISIDAKTALCESYGIKECVLWHIGNNKYGLDKIYVHTHF